MICMKRITVSVPDDLVDEARRAVERGEAASVSGYVTAALRDYGQGETLRELLDRWDRELGPVPSEIAAEVDREFEKFFGPLPEDGR